LSSGRSGAERAPRRVVRPRRLRWARPFRLRRSGRWQRTRRSCGCRPPAPAPIRWREQLGVFHQDLPVGSMDREHLAGDDGRGARGLCLLDDEVPAQRQPRLEQGARQEIGPALRPGGVRCRGERGREIEDQLRVARFRLRGRRGRQPRPARPPRPSTSPSRGWRWRSTADPRWTPQRPRPRLRALPPKRGPATPTAPTTATAPGSSSGSAGTAPEPILSPGGYTNTW